ncbi:unannotated protein [freshwater metagenome]|uniref:Unannotated protein n=1 Tax=freshwater metagenome TaxID=449393 RepID=A0A6J7J0M0_9ZZZZ
MRRVCKKFSETSCVSSTTLCSIPPASVISTIIKRAGVRDTNSIWRTRDFTIDGYCTTATCFVTSASSLTVRITTSSKSSAPSRKLSIARRSAPDSGLTSANLSTKTRYPLSVGIRPALVCGCVIRPSSSKTAISLRIVAGEIPRPWRSAMDFEPTGSCVATYSSTIARRISRRREDIVLARILESYFAHDSICD